MQFRLPDATHAVPTQLSPGVQTLPSALQALPEFCATSLQTPVAGAQVFFLHVVSPALEQLTTVAASTSHLWLFRLQINVPSHKSPFSNAAQSAFFWHWQVLLPPWQVPPLQVSPAVQTFPSSQAMVLLTCLQPLPLSHESLVQGLLSSHALAGKALPLQIPLAHTSPVVQASASSHCTLLLAKTQPLAGSQESLVHNFPSSQVIPLPAQVPPLQTSPFVQALPSLQLAVLLTFAQPLAGMQLSSVHALPSPHTLATSIALPAHLPPAQTSPLVQKFPSSQEMLLFTLLQPLPGSQLSLVHGLPSSQFRPTPAQVPPAHTSPLVHALPSLHASLVLVLTQFPPAHTSVVQPFLSSQSFWSPARQSLLAHTSPIVHGFPSSHALLLGVWTQPFTLSQPSSVHGFLSSQSNFFPAPQVPPLQVSPSVQTEPSALHAPPSFWLTMLHRPVALLQVFFAQTLSPAALQLTTVFASTTHVWLPRSHTNVPSQRFPFSELAQSAVPVHWQELVPLLHFPSAHTSPLVQPLPSSHGALLFTCVQPLVASQPSVVHALPSLQSMLTLIALPEQLPPPQMSPEVQGFPSSQPFVFGTLTQPLAGSQESLVHGLPSSQLTEKPAQMLAPHTSPVLQALPSSHGTALGALPHSPLLQKSLVHKFSSSQTMALPLHIPAAQTSLTVQPMPSSHALALGVWTQPMILSQLSSVHTLLSSQFRPPLHRSRTLHSALSTAVWTHPWLSSQPSVEHTLPSSQFLGAETQACSTQLNVRQANFANGQSVAVTHSGVVTSEPPSASSATSSAAGTSGSATSSATSVVPPSSTPSTGEAASSSLAASTVASNASDCCGTSG